MKRNKFNATRVTIDGIKFASKREAKRYSELKLLEMAKEIFNLELQPVFPLIIDGKEVKIRSKGFPNGRKCKYTADFKYTTADGEIIIEDSKGFDTTSSRLRRAVVECIYGIHITLV